MNHTSIDVQQRPKLNRGARLRFDEPSNSYVLLSPERALFLNTSAGEVVRRCDGTRTVAQIADELAECTELDESRQLRAEAPDSPVAPAEISRDILQLLVELRRKQLVQFDGLI
jgi:coenzyme PQQ biosynthesis protein PqqD